jgi:hypothetical protein
VWRGGVPDAGLSATAIQISDENAFEIQGDDTIV